MYFVYKIQNVFMYYAGYNKSIMNVHNKNAFVANIVIWLLGTSFRLRRLYAWNISTCVPSSSINIFFFSALSGVEELEMGPSTRYCGDLWTPFNLIPCACDNSGLVHDDMIIWFYNAAKRQRENFPHLSWIHYSKYSMSICWSKVSMIVYSNVYSIHILLIVMFVSFKAYSYYSD